MRVGARLRDGAIVLTTGRSIGTDVISEPKGGFRPQEAIVGEATEAIRSNTH